MTAVHGSPSGVVSAESQAEIRGVGGGGGGVSCQRNFRERGRRSDRD